MESSSFCGSSKRAKAPGNITQIARCLVDGCNADLSLCRDYYRRHKVCEIHSKTPKVTIGGREQRFCQQCSRFHSLVEFDEGKRSCRKRLEGHNRRRRKPQPDSFPRNSSLIFPSPPGPTLLSFTAPQTSIVGPSWPLRAVKLEDEPMLFNNHHHLNNYIDRPPTSFPKNQLQFIQQEAATCQPVIESDRALSLLSSVSTRDPQAHQFHSLQYTGLGGEYVAGSGAPASHGSEASAMHFPEMNEGSSTNGSHQTLTFMWE